MNTFDYDNTHSKWLDVIARSEQDWDGYVIANIMYSDKKASNMRVYNTYYWVPIETYEELANSPSQGSVYWNKWSVYGTPETRYNGQDQNIQPSNTETRSELDNVDSKVLMEAVNERDTGTLDKWLDEEYDGDEESIDKITTWLDRYDNGMELFERSEEISKLIKAEQLTSKKAMKTFMLDIQEMFGVSIDKRFMFGQISKVSGGKFNPNQFTKYKYQMKQIYDTMSKEGLEGVQNVGARILSANNPFIRDRRTYKGIEALKSLGNKNWLEGEDAVKAIEKFHRKELKAHAEGFQKRNRMNLIVKKTRQGKTVARWGKNVSKGRKIITIGKKALRIGKWFI